MFKQGGRGELAAAFHFFFPPHKESLVSRMEGVSPRQMLPLRRETQKPKLESTSNNLRGQIRRRRLPLESPGMIRVPPITAAPSIQPDQCATYPATSSLATQARICLQCRHAFDCVQ